MQSKLEDEIQALRAAAAARKDAREAHELADVSMDGIAPASEGITV